MLFIWLYIIIFSDDELDGGGILNFFPIVAVSGNTMKNKKIAHRQISSNPDRYINKFPDKFSYVNV